jgi:hypothetical protein
MLHQIPSLPSVNPVPIRKSRTQRPFSLLTSVKTLIHTLIIPIPTTLIKGFVFLVINELFQGKSAQTSSANPYSQSISTRTSRPSITTYPRPIYLIQHLASAPPDWETVVQRVHRILVLFLKPEKPGRVKSDSIPLSSGCWS